ncbi:MAG: phage major capsid protein [Methylococcaceae bacterium]|nr:phage major capsid protein [Methylococcaceae bacterium]
MSQFAPKPLGKPVLAGSTLTPLKASAIIVTTRESLRFSATEALLQKDLQRAVIETLDQAFIDSANAGIAGETPASVTNGAPASASSGDPRDDLNTLISNFGGNLDMAYLVTDPATAAELALFRDTGGSYPFADVSPKGGSLLGFPLVTSRSSPRDTSGGQMALIDPSLIAYATAGITLDTANATALLMDDGPGTPSNLVSLYQTDSVAFRAEALVNWQVQTPGAVVVITGCNYA